MTANNDALPPLPEPFGELERRGVWNGLPRSGFDDVFDADQMRDYARAAIRALSADDDAADHILDLRDRAKVAEAQLQDAWRELACSDDIAGPTLCGAINQLQRAREAAEASLAACRAEHDALLTRVDHAVAMLSAPRTLSQFMGPNDMALYLMDERTTVAASLLAVPAGEAKP